MNCSNSGITDLEGCPQEIRGDLELYNNYSLETLKGGAQVVGRSVKIENCVNLTSLEGGPKKVGSLDLFKEHGIYAGQFLCQFCDLKDLEGAPEVVYGTFNVTISPKKEGIKSLKGGPKVVYGCYTIIQNSPVLSLEGAPQTVAPTASFISDWEFNVKGQSSDKYLQYIRGVSKSEEKINAVKEQLRKKQMNKINRTQNKLGEQATKDVEGKRELPKGVKMSKRMKKGEFNIR